MELLLDLSVDDFGVLSCENKVPRQAWYAGARETNGDTVVDHIQ